MSHGQQNFRIKQKNTDQTARPQSRMRTFALHLSTQQILLTGKTLRRLRESADRLDSSLFTQASL